MPFIKNAVGLTFETMARKVYILLSFLLLTTAVVAQTDSTKEVEQKPAPERSFMSQRAVLFRFNYIYTIPTADLAKRFTFIAQLGGSVGMKFENGWDLRAEGSFMFSKYVAEYSVFDSIANKDGYLVDRSGYNFLPNISMRGFTAGLHLGRLFPLGRNHNSGILVSLGAGFIQHRLHFQNLSSLAPQVSGDILKGYDRLTNGYTINQFVGYQYMSMNKMLNFYVGLDFAQGRTQYARNWNNDLRGPDTRTRADNYWGIRLGWILPIYGTNRGEDEFIFR